MFLMGLIIALVLLIGFWVVGWTDLWPSVSPTLMRPANRGIAAISAVLATVVIRIWFLQGVSKPVREGVSFVVMLVLLSPVMQWQWRKGFWWSVPLGGLAVGVLTYLDWPPQGPWDSLVPVAIATGLIIQYVRRRRSA